MRRGNLNQRRAAAQLGFHYTTLNKFLTGYRRPGRENAIQIERGTGIPVEAWSPTSVGKYKKRRVA